MEIWKACEDWAKHEVSNLGNVRSLEYGSPRPMRLKVCANGYRSTSDHLVHRLVAKAFLSRAPRRPWVNHKNGNKADNRVENLEWSTPRQNNAHANARGVRHAMTNPKRAHKLTAEIVAEMRTTVPLGAGAKAAAERYGISTTLLQRILRYKSWKMPIIL